MSMPATAMADPTVKSARTRRAAWVLLVLIVGGSSSLLVRGLDSDYITLWDEAIHVNVVQNLMTHCCTPRLHLQDYGSDFRDWTDNDVWLHKPPLPFFINAGMASLRGGGSLLALRFPSLLFAEGIVVLVFLMGVRFFGLWAGALGAALLAFNHFTSLLVHGRQFSGIPDLTLAFFLMGALYCLLSIAGDPQRKYFVAFGTVSGLAFLCKDGLAFIPFFVLAALVIRLGWRQHAAAFIYAAAIALLIAAAGTTCLALLFPAEALHEQHQRIAHLLGDVEGWSRPSDYYLSVYFITVTSPHLAGLGHLSVLFGLLNARTNLRMGVLAAWVASYLVVLSAGVSKISNFIYPTVPVICLLIAVVVTELSRRRQYAVILAGCITIVATAAILHMDLFGINWWLVPSPSWRTRFAVVFLQWAIFASTLTVMRVSQIAVSPQLSLAGILIAAAVVLGASARSNLASSSQRAGDYDNQIALRQAALALSRHVPQEDVVLVSWPAVPRSHLFVKFWSGRDGFEVDESHPLEARLALVQHAPGVYLLRDTPAPRFGEPRRVGTGYLYSLR
jgi:4-amino-4-deoxy-L-arabinose transferase-like glycosyltransferase